MITLDKEFRERKHLGLKLKAVEYYFEFESFFIFHNDHFQNELAITTPLVF